MTNPVIYAAAYLLLLGQPIQAPGPTPIATTTIECQLPCAPGRDCDASGRPIDGHITSHRLSIVRALLPRHHHHRRGHHWGRHDH